MASTAPKTVAMSFAKLADKLGDGGEVRLVVSTQGHEGRIPDTGVGDGTTTDEALGISEQDDFEQHRWRISWRAGIIITVTGIEMRQVKLMINEIIEGMFEGAGTQLFRQIEGNELQIGVEVVVARHAQYSRVLSDRYHTDHRDSAKFPPAADVERVFLHPR